MPLIAWTTDMSVEVPSIDVQHRGLVALLNGLYDAVREGRGAAAVGDTLTGLIAYTQEHFRHEEELFAQTGYPQAEEHAQEHTDLCVQLSEIHSKFASGATHALSEETLHFLLNWVMTHTMGSDKNYSAHLVKHGAK